MNTKYLEKADHSVVREIKTVVVDRELSYLVKTNGGITPQMVVDSAMPENSALHKYFEWNDTEAGKKYRVNQATAMIIATRFVCMLNDNKKSIVNSNVSVREYLPVHDTERTFKPRAEILGDDENRKLIVDRKISVLRSWCQSVVDIEELKEIREKILLLVG